MDFIGISQNRSISDNSFSTSLTNSNNSILSTKENVNRNTTNLQQNITNNPINPLMQQLLVKKIKWLKMGI